MPINASPEFFVAERRYSEARTKKEKMAALNEMIRKAPKHKSSEKLLRDLKKRLKKLKEEMSKEESVSSKSKPKYVIRKEGSAQVCVVGPTNSGKSALLKVLTGAKVDVAEYPFTTQFPAVGMMDYTGVGIQMVEIPSTFTPDVISLIRSCDLALIVLDGTGDLDEQLDEIVEIFDANSLDDKKILIATSKSDLKKVETILHFSAKTGEGIDRLKREIWSRLGLIRVYTQSVNGQKAGKPLTLKPGSTVKDATKQVHKDMLKNFKFARIFNTTKYSGRKVGLEYVLSDLDVVEIHSG